MRLALYEPDIPQNLGAFIRLARARAWPSTSSSRAASRSTDKRIRGPRWTTTTWRASSGMPPGPAFAATGRPAGWFC